MSGKKNLLSSGYNGKSFTTNATTTTNKAATTISANFENLNLEVSGDEALPLLENCGTKFVLNEENLKTLLLNEKIKQTPVCVISIAGGLRMGKSFMLTLMLRYLESEGWKEKPDEWLKKNQETILRRGFSWKNDSVGHTQGINAWSKPVIVQKCDGTKIAIILLDTQGDFDNRTSKEKSARVFGLSTLCSSLQIINVMRQIESRDLEHLQAFVEFSKAPIARQDLDVVSGLRENTKIFQDLLFLVRDWSFNNYDYGHEGGTKYLSNLQSGIIESANENVSVMDYLTNAFKNIGCYLMPIPERKVLLASADHNLRISEIGDEFSQYVMHFFNEYINPKKLTLKTAGPSDPATGKDLYEYIRVCAESILSGEGLSMMSEMKAIAEFCNNKCKEDALHWYREHLDEKLDGTESWDDYNKMIAEAKVSANERFRSKMWYGGSASSVPKLQDDLFKDIDSIASGRMNEKFRKIAEKEAEERHKREVLRATEKSEAEKRQLRVKSADQEAENNRLRQNVAQGEAKERQLSEELKTCRTGNEDSSIKADIASIAISSTAAGVTGMTVAGPVGGVVGMGVSVATGVGSLVIKKLFSLKGASKSQ